MDGRSARALVLAGFVAVGMMPGCVRSSKEVPPAIPVRELCRIDASRVSQMTMADTVAWVRSEFGEDPDTDTDVLRGQQVEILMWPAHGGSGNADLVGGRLRCVSLMDVKNGPTFGEVVAELGTPEAISTYTVAHEKVAYSIKMHYPAQGITVAGSRLAEQRDLMHGDRLLAPLEEDIRLDRVERYQAGTMEAVLRDAYLAREDEVPQALERMASWPGFGGLIPLRP